MSFLTSNKAFVAGFVVLLCVGTWLRLVNIEDRPMHGDEANQAYQFQLLWESGDYKYEPRDYHGPTLYYVTVPWMKILGVSTFEETRKAHFRSLPLFFGLLTALTGLLLIDLLSRKGVLFLTAFQMLSPSMIYYSTYYIQESLLVFGVALFSASLWRFWQSKKLVWLIVSGASFGFMHATKETFIISIFAFLVPLIFLFFNRRKSLMSEISSKRVLSLAFSAMVVSVLFYSSFLSNPRGPIDSVLAFTSHIGRGLGTEVFPEHMTASAAHAKSPSYYLHNLLGHYPRKLSSTVKDILDNNGARPISEILFFVLWVASLTFRLKGKGRLYKANLFFSLQTLLLLGVYSMIPYKTPWCAQVIILSMATSAALYMSRLSMSPYKKAWLGACTLTLIMSVDLFRQGQLITQQGFSVSDRNQYAYSHAVVDVENLVERIEEMSSVSGLQENMPIHFFTGEYWPLPWYLKKFNKVGYWEDKKNSFSLQEVPVIITNPDREDIKQQLAETHVVELRSRIPGYWLEVFYRKDLWRMYMKNNESKAGLK